MTVEVLIDSSVWIDHLRGTLTPQVQWLRARLVDGEAEILLADLVLYEVLRGVPTDAQARKVASALAVFPLMSLTGADMAVLAATHYRKMRQLGFTVSKLADSFIASFCIREGVSLLHSDADFDAYERHLKLQVVKA
jgi:predicted nucleic acid-binding protein